MTRTELGSARALLEQAQRIVVVTGAGVSAESGVPTFRGTEGLWRSYRPEQLATPEAFAADPRLVWEWYDMRRRAVASCEPNAGHVAIARASLEHSSCHVITQNVDGLHHLALYHQTLRPPAEQLPVTLHGSLFAVRCSRCTYSRDDRETVDSSTIETLPRCPECSALLRPGVVWFGEALDHEILNRAWDLASRADVCLVAGTSAIVQPAASIPLASLESGGVVIEVNPEETPLSTRAALSLRGTAGEILPQLLA